jgi:hypothetical protein
MTPTTNSAKNRTVALPKITKNMITGQQGNAKDNSTDVTDAVWSGLVFGPYLVALSRRAE